MSVAADTEASIFAAKRDREVDAEVLFFVKPGWITLRTCAIDLREVIAVESNASFCGPNFAVGPPAVVYFRGGGQLNLKGPDVAALRELMRPPKA